MARKREGNREAMGHGETAGINWKVLNRDVIKYLAAAAMVFNHIAHMFLARGTPLYELLEDIGFFTAPVMCFFLVEGYGYTRSKMRYGLRLLLFSAISQLPYALAFRFGNLNMIYTLLCCFLILAVLERVANPLWRTSLCALLVSATLAGDWALVAPLFTVMFYNSRGSRGKMIGSFAAGYGFLVLLNIEKYAGGSGEWTACAVAHALLAGLGIAAAAAVLLVFYNGRRAEKHKNFSKWFFYLFYPAHLLVLCAVRACIGM